MSPSAGLLFALALSLCLDVSAVSLVRRNPISLQNGNDAIALKYAFSTPLPDLLSLIITL